MDTTQYRMSGSFPRDSKSDPIKVLSPGTVQVKSYTNVAAAIDNATASTTSIVRVTCSTAAYIKIAETPTAAATDMYMPAGKSEYFKITPGHKVSAIRVASNGILNVCEMTL